MGPARTCTSENRSEIHRPRVGRSCMCPDLPCPSYRSQMSTPHEAMGSHIALVLCTPLIGPTNRARNSHRRSDLQQNTYRHPPNSHIPSKISARDHAMLTPMHSRILNNTHSPCATALPYLYAFSTTTCGNGYSKACWVKNLSSCGFQRWEHLKAPKKRVKIAIHIVPPKRKLE